jgi:hypothetical protein
MSDQTVSPDESAQQENLRAHLAGVEWSDSGAATLWLSDEVTTMHFPLTRQTVPALLAQLDQLSVPDNGKTRPDPREFDEYEDISHDRDVPDETEELPEEEPVPGRLARWTGWHYSNSLVSRIPPQQRIALFAVIVVILLLITLFH